LIHFPEKVLEMDLAYTIISVGMRDEGSMFSGGKTFKDYIHVEDATGHILQVDPARRKMQYAAARDLVNSKDKLPVIVENAVKFEALLNVSRVDAPHWSQVLPPLQPLPTVTTPRPPIRLSVPLGRF
jgi:hypothetical protein